MQEIKIGSFTIGARSKPFLVAEMSGNHNGSLKRALELVDAAAASGADALKLQTYKPETMTSKSGDCGFLIEDRTSPWYGEDLYSLYEKAQTPWSWHGEIFAYARSKGLLCFSSVFEESSVDFLESLEVPLYKIASFENSHYPLLKRVAQTGKPILLSTGVSTLEEIAESVAFLRESGCRELVLLKCTSNYPSDPSHSNLQTMAHMEKLFRTTVGISDHTLGIGVAIAAVALGAKVVEKHLTLSRAEGGVDSAFSLEPAEFKMLVDQAQVAFAAIGQVEYALSEEEKRSRIYKRSIFVVESIKKGERLEKKHLRILRPAKGLSPKHYDSVLGREVREDVAAGTALAWSML